MIIHLLLVLVGSQQVLKYDWINNYFALSCTCPDDCCLYGSFVLQNDDVMNTNFISISGKLKGKGCKSTTITNSICILDTPTLVQTTLSCPGVGWEWQVSKDSNTGSIYWTDSGKCQGVWNVIDLEAHSIVYLNAITINVLMIMILLVN